MRFVAPLAALAILISASVCAEDAPWPQWRGPSRDGQIDEAEWPDSLQGDSLKELWSVELGKSYSGPIVASDRVFVTESVNESEEVVRAFDRKTGRELWKTGWPSEFQVIPMGRPRGNWIRSTGAYDGERLYVGGMRDVLACIDGETGNVIWKRNLAEEYNVPLQPFGLSASPLVEGDALYVQAARSLLKLDKRTGKEIWRTLIEKDPVFDEGGALSSPVLAHIDGRQMIVAINGEVNGVDPKTGAVLWSGAKDESTSPLIMTPTLWSEKIFISSGLLRSGLWEVQKSGEGYSLGRLWENKTVVYMSSPVIVGDHVYLHLKNQRLACIDLKTGSETWITSQRFGMYLSMLVNGDRILALSENGSLYLFAANPERFELVDQRDIAATEAWAYIAPAGDELYIRALNALSVYRWAAPE